MGSSQDAWQMAQAAMSARPLREAGGTTACPACKSPTNRTQFADGLSVKEYEISGLCQTCQDKTFTTPTEVAPMEKVKDTAMTPEKEALISWIEEQYHTGSRVIGGFTPESDWDYVAVRSEAIAKARELGMELQDESSSSEYYAEDAFSFKYRRTITDPWINLILVEDEFEHASWMFATVKCRNLYLQGCLLTKKTRVKLFRCLRQVYLLDYKTISGGE